MVVHNPNNWHWVDKNCIEWAQQYFESNLLTTSATQNDTTVSIKSMKKLEGDVEVCQRKGKVISLFDLKLVLNFESTSGVKGSITIPEVAYDTEIDDFQFITAFEKQEYQNDDTVRSLLKNNIIPELRTKLSKFGSDLIKVHGNDVQVDQSEVNSKFTKSNSITQDATKPIVTSKTTFNKSPSTPVATTSASSTSSTIKNTPKYNTSKLTLSATFNTSADQLYLTLLDPQRVAKWTRSQPNIQPVENTPFDLFGGNIHGQIVKLVKNEKINMLWRLKDWKEGHYTKLTIDLKEGPGETEMIVSFDGVPVGEEDKVRENFEGYYIRSIKLTFGFGAVL